MKTFEGFGGAFNEMGWNYLSMLSAADRDRAMKLLFDATDGAHFVMGRIPIGASDYALQRYTDDETANDTSLSQLLDHPGHEVPDPVRQGRAGGQRQHPLLGQPVDAADLDEDEHRHGQRHVVRAGGRHGLRRRVHAGHRREPDGARQVLRDVGPGVRGAGDHDRDGRAAERAQLRPGLPVGAVGVAALHEVRRPVSRSRIQHGGAEHEDHARHEVQRQRAARTRRWSPP